MLITREIHEIFLIQKIKKKTYAYINPDAKFFEK